MISTASLVSPRETKQLPGRERVVRSSLSFLLGHLAVEVALFCFACAVGQPFHDVTFTAMKCIRSMYVVENGRQKFALLQITCSRGNTLQECR